MRKRMLAAVVAAAICTTILAGTGGPAAADGGHPDPTLTLAEILPSKGSQRPLNMGADRGEHEQETKTRTALEFFARELLAVHAEGA